MAFQNIPKNYLHGDTIKDYFDDHDNAKLSKVPIVFHHRLAHHHHQNKNLPKVPTSTMEEHAAFGTLPSVPAQQVTLSDIKAAVHLHLGRGFSKR